MSQEPELQGADTIEEKAAVQVEVGEDGVQETKKMKKWLASQDQLLAKQVLAEDPFGSARGSGLASKKHLGMEIGRRFEGVYWYSVGATVCEYLLF